MDTTRSSYWHAKSDDEKRLQTLILDTLAIRGLSGWSVIFSRERKRLGSCNFSAKEIMISRLVVKSDWAIAVDTAMHEVAHAIAGLFAGHGPAWKRVALELGAEPEAKTRFTSSHQHGVAKQVSTIYGPVTVTPGETKINHPSLGELKILELMQKHFIAADEQGREHSIFLEQLHPDFGDSSKIIERRVVVKGYRGESIEIIVGKSSYIHRGERYIAAKPLKSNVLAIGPRGDFLRVPSEWFTN